MEKTSIQLQHLTQAVASKPQVMVSYVEASAVLKQAVALDTQGNDPHEVLGLYRQGLRLLREVVQRDGNAARKAQVATKLREYAQRAGVLQASLHPPA